MFDISLERDSMTRRILILPIGIPGSGKSTFMNQIHEKYGIPVVSSDSVREQLYGDESIQGDFNKVFSTVYKNVNDHLDKEEICILDATNVTRKVRIKAIRNTNPTQVIYVLMDNNIHQALSRNSKRDRVVPEYVIIRMWQSFTNDFPDYKELTDFNIKMFQYTDIGLERFLEAI